jgi:UDP-glucose 4-epimerase
MRALGWKPELSIRQGIVRTLEFLRANPWVLEARA